MPVRYIAALHYITRIMLWHSKYTGN